MHQPHDKIVKDILSNPNTAKEFFSLYLPKEVLSVINLNYLKLEKDTFLDEKFRAYAVDLLYQTKIGNKDAYIWILIEHQSTEDFWMPVRVFEYIALIWRHFRKTHHESKTIPLVYPIIIYNGKEPYEASLNLSDLIAPLEAKTIFNHLFTQPFCLIDLSQISDEKLRTQAQKNVKAVSLLMALKHVYNRNIQTYFEHYLTESLKLVEATGDIDHVVGILYYLLARANFTEIEQFKLYIRQTFTQRTEKQFMTGAELLIQQGMQQEKRQVAYNLAQEGMQPSFIHKVTGLSLKEIEALMMEVI